MARSDLFSKLRRIAHLALAAHRRGRPVDALVAQARDRTLQRRTLLKAAAAASAAAVATRGGIARAAGHTRTSDVCVGIVGAGLAGLLCAYRLQQAGIRATVFDAGARSGGRIYTLRHGVPHGQAAELGGEFIDSEHVVMHGLVEEFGLQLDDLLDDPDISADRWWFDDQILDPTRVAQAFVPVALRMQADLAAADASEAEFERLDALSIEAWLDQQDELDPLLRELLVTAYIGEYGRETDEQSAFNLLWLIDSEEPDPFKIFGSSDERFHIRGGNDQLTRALHGALERDVQLDRRLVRVREKSSGAFELSFDRDGHCIDRSFDKVVFALPFTQLRGVELERVDLPASKLQIIRELGYGTNAKLIGRFGERTWRQQHASSGSGFSDLSAQCFWDASRKEPGREGLLTVFLGGEAGVAAGQGSPEEQMRSQLAALDQIFPGTAKAYCNGSAVRAHWPSAPHFEGSYACFLPGQAVWSGTEGEAVGPLHFCGEHTSEDFQGYMEGAAESGERVATEILTSLGIAPGGVPGSGAGGRMVVALE